MLLESNIPFDVLLPKAITWAEEQSGLILESGRTLDAREREIARKTGVQHPELIRIAEVAEIPKPEDPELLQAAESIGFMGPGVIGLTLEYGIFIRRGYLTIRLLSHECRHVQQYEATGSIRAYLPIYLQQLLAFGYNDMPFELDARRHELHQE